MKDKLIEGTKRVLVAVPLLYLGYKAFHEGGWWWELFCLVFFTIGVTGEVGWRLHTCIQKRGAPLHSYLLITSGLVGGAMMISLHDDKVGRGLILLGAIMVICFDTFSLIAGWFQPKRWRRSITKESPKKTWGGFIGGTLLSWVAGVFVIDKIESSYVVLDINRPVLYLTMMLLPFVAFYGDLNESMAKRRMYRTYHDQLKDESLKDMSKLLYVHGGVSDRFDALLAVFSTIGVVWNVMVYF